MRAGFWAGAMAIASVGRSVRRTGSTFELASGADPTTSTTLLPSPTRSAPAPHSCDLGGLPVDSPRARSCSVRLQTSPSLALCPRPPLPDSVVGRALVWLLSSVSVPVKMASRRSAVCVSSVVEGSVWSRPVVGRSSLTSTARPRWGSVKGELTPLISLPRLRPRSRPRCRVQYEALWRCTCWDPSWPWLMGSSVSGEGAGAVG